MANYRIPLGYILTLVCDSSTTGTYARVAAGAYTKSDSPTSLSASSTTVLGPYTDERVVEVVNLTGAVSATVSWAEFVTATDLALKAPIASPTFTGTVTAPILAVTKVNGTEADNVVTASGNAGRITTSALTTAAGASYDITWTNTRISATSSILLTHAGGTNTKQIGLKVVAGSGTATLTIYNVDLLAALDGTVLINYLVV